MLCHPAVVNLSQVCSMTMLYRTMIYYNDGYDNSDTLKPLLPAGRCNHFLGSHDFHTSMISCHLDVRFGVTIKLTYAHSLSTEYDTGKNGNWIEGRN